MLPCFECYCRSIIQVPDVSYVTLFPLLALQTYLQNQLVKEFTQFNGECGCSFCEDKGLVMPVGKGHARAYPYIPGPTQYSKEQKNASLIKERWPSRIGHTCM